MPGSPARCGFAAPVPSGSGISLPRSPASVPDGSSNGEALLGVLTLCQFVHAQVVGRPPFRVAVWGVEPEDADRSVASQVQDGARGADGRFVKGPGTAISGGYLAVAFQPGQPEPAIVAYLLEVLRAGVPAVEKHVLRGEAMAAGHQHHLPEMVVLGLAVGLAVEPVVAGDLAVAVGPQQGDQVDPADGLAMLARPVAGHQADVLGVRLVECRVVEDQGPAGPINGGLGLGPESIGIGLQPLQQPGERIMRRGEGGPGLHAFGLRAADSSPGSDQEVDVRLIGAVRCVHNRILRSVNALIKCTCTY